MIDLHEKDIVKKSREMRVVTEKAIISLIAKHII